MPHLSAVRTTKLCCVGSSANRETCVPPADKATTAAKVAPNEFFIAIACLKQIIAPKALSIAQYP
jgi:hypothetical protein